MMVNGRNHFGIGGRGRWNNPPEEGRIHQPAVAARAMIKSTLAAPAHQE